MSKALHDREAAETRPVRADKRWFQAAAALLGQARLSGGRAIDLACGNAEFSERLRDAFHMDVTCVDYVESYVAAARDRGFDALQLDLEAEDLLASPMLSQHRGRYDLAVMLEGIEHIFDTDHLLAFIHALLRPGGRLLLSTPNISFVGYRLYSFLHGNVPFGDGHHVRFFDDRRLRSFLYLAGFQAGDALSANYGGIIPLDRLCTPRSRLPRWAGRPLAGLLHYPPGRWLLPRSWRDQGLVLLAERADVTPLSLFWRRTRSILDAAAPEDRASIRRRLEEARRLGYLDEHPGFLAFMSELDEQG